MTHDILLVDDDPGMIQLLGQVLQPCGDLRFATNGEDALRLMRESPPDLVLLDAEMPGLSGFQVCLAMKADRALADVPVIFITSHSQPSMEVSGFDLGAVDFIAKPVSPSLVRARVSAQLRAKYANDELRRISGTDVLTGVANRRQFDEALEREWRRCRRTGDALSLLMVDIDHFKAFNDRYGHPAGDACLRAVAQAMVGATARPGDLVARYGGEEFAVLLPQTPRPGARQVARNVLRMIESLGIAHEASPTARHVTVSLGVSCYDDSSDGWVLPSSESRYVDDLRKGCSPLTLLQAADRALYSAKHAGRARARMLDIDDVDAPQLACQVD